MDVERLNGAEPTVTLPVRAGAGQLLQLGHRAFRNGPAALFIGPGREQEWSDRAYLQTTFSDGGGAAPF